MYSAMYEDHLARVPLFRDLSPRELTWLSAGCREREYDAGAVLARAGHSGGGLLILLRGRAARTEPQPDGSEHPAGQFEPGAVIGEMSLYGEVPHKETVTALEPCVVLALPRWDFQATLRESPDIAIRLLAALCERALQTERRDAGLADPTHLATNHTTDHPVNHPTGDYPQKAS